MFRNRLQKTARLRSMNLLKMVNSRGFAAEGVRTEELRSHLLKLGITNT